MLTHGISDASSRLQLYLTQSHLTYILLACTPLLVCSTLYLTTSIRDDNIILLGTLTALALVIFFEWYIPNDTECRLTANRRELKLNLAFIPVVSFGADLPLKIFAYSLLLPWITSIALVSWPNEWSVAIQILILLLISNFLSYWWHRLMHVTEWGWRIHRVHHSSRVFNWTIGPKVHLFDAFSVGFINLLPLLIFDVQGKVYVMTIATRLGFELLTHINIKMNLSFWNYIFVTPSYHMWHHSASREESNHNYSVLFIFFDRIFGTLYFPKQQSAPDRYGLMREESWLTTGAEISTFRLLFRLLMSPFTMTKPTSLP
jgi:sterol desaturase/sphingolipid hydroxylase (fatty acid hydroxylase superfamily)